MSAKKSAIDYAYKYLSRFPKTEKELIIQLQKKHYTQKEIKVAVKILKKNKILDDRKFCKLYINSELIRKWKPIIAVKQKLVYKWISKDLVEEMLYKYSKEIKKWIQKKNKKIHRKLQKKMIKLTWNCG